MHVGDASIEAEDEVNRSFFFEGRQNVEKKENLFRPALVCLKIRRARFVPGSITRIAAALAVSLTFLEFRWLASFKETTVYKCNAGRE